MALLSPMKRGTPPTPRDPAPEHEPDDGLLVRQHLAGAEHALPTLFRRYQPRLVLHCTTVLADRSAAEDIAQDSFARAVRYAESFNTDRPLWPWLKVIATRLCYDHNARTHATATLTGVSQVFPDHAPDVEEQALVADALACLPARQRAALIRVYMNDEPVTSAAAAMGMQRNALDQLLFRARNNMRAAYRQLSGEARAPVVLAPVGAFLRRLRGMLQRCTFATEPIVQPLEVVARSGLGHVIAVLGVIGVAGAIAIGNTPASGDPRSPNERQTERLHASVPAASKQLLPARTGAPSAHRRPNVKGSQGHKPRADRDRRLQRDAPRERQADMATSAPSPPPSRSEDDTKLPLEAAGPTASVKRTRADDRGTTSAEMEAGPEETPGGPIEAEGAHTMRCDDEVRAVVCDALDELTDVPATPAPTVEDSATAAEHPRIRPRG